MPGGNVVLNATRVVVGACLAILLASAPAVACTCLGSDIQTRFRSARTIVVGRVMESRPGDGSTSFLAATRVAVEEAIRGGAGAELIVRHFVDGNVCGVRFQPGERVTIFAGAVRNGEAETSSCLMPVMEEAAMAAVVQAYRERIAQVDRLVAQHPTDIGYRLDRAALLDEWGDGDLALASYADIVARWPQDRRGWFAQGVLLFRRDRLPDAIASLARAVALDPGNTEARRLLGQARVRTGDLSRIGETDFRDIVLANVALPSASLAGRDFSGAALNGVDLRAADLSRIRAVGAHFTNVDFSRARLERAYFAAATISGTLADANLRGADLSRVTLEGELVRTDLRNVTGNDVRFAGTLEATRFDGARLRDVSFLYARITNVDFTNARLERADFRRARLAGVDLSRTPTTGLQIAGARYDCRTRFPPRLDPLAERAIPVDRACVAPGWRPVFDDLDLPDMGMDFSELDLRGASFRRALIQAADFARANLEGADFTDASGAARFDGANLTNADFTGAHDLGSFFGDPRPNMTGAVLRGVVLEPLDFVSRAGWVPTDITQARLEGAIVRCDGLAGDRIDPRRDAAIAWIRSLAPRRPA